MTALGTSGGATATNTGALTYSGREYKDFHLQLSYRAAQRANNGGVIVPGGAQVAILDNGTAATRSGAIVGARGRAAPPSTSRCASGTPST